MTLAEGTAPTGVQKLRTGIPGFDEICLGGLPIGRTTLVSGTAGAGKSVFSAHFLAAGIVEYAEAGVYVTFEETPELVRENLEGFGWQVSEWESDGSWQFIDASPDVLNPAVVVGYFDFGALVARIERAVRQTGATRVVLDSIGTVFEHFNDDRTVRTELYRMASALRQLGVTALITIERPEEYGALSRHAVSQFVSDNVVILRNALDAERRRRTVEILKFRGADHRKGEYPFSLIAGTGAVVLPLSSLLLEQGSANRRVPSGNHDLDEMCGGGLYQDSIVLVSGPTGAGKTLLGCSFINGTPENQRSLMFSFEEGREQIYRNAAGWGFDFASLESEGRFHLEGAYPELLGLEDHLINMGRAIDEFQPTRVVVDSLSALERVASPKAYREFIIGLTSMLKDRRICSVFTAATSAAFGGSGEAVTHVSTITDAIILLRYVEFYGEIRRGMTVLKMRGSSHDPEIREFTIGRNGMAIGGSFQNINGILSGQVEVKELDEIERIKNLFVDVGVDLTDSLGRPGGDTR